MLRNKNILLISPEPWDHIFVSKHHYAVHLADRGNRVFFLNPPGGITSMMSTNFPDVFEVNYPGFPSGLRFYPQILQKKIILKAYKRLEALCSTCFDVVWSFDNSLFYDFSSLPSHLVKISHIVDANQDFQTQKAASTADFCFCTTDFIKAKLTCFNQRVFKINHGYSHSPLSNGIGSSIPALRMSAIYAGNLSTPYIDWRLLCQVAESNPEVDFIFIGPHATVLSGDPVMRSAKAKVLESPNCFFPGRVESDKLQEYCSAADVLLVAYLEKYHADQAANPHKMMEYLGSGKVVVATCTFEYLELDRLIIMSGKNSEWPGLFKKVISKLGYYNSEELQSQRIAFAFDNSYERQINKIEQIINS